MKTGKVVKTENTMKMERITRIENTVKSEKIMIRLECVTKCYEQSHNTTNALDQIDLTIKEGEHLAIVGKSGSGKSTLLNMLTGIDRPTSGKVIMNGCDIHQMSESKLATWRGKNIGIVFQFFQLIPTLTILENLLLAMDFVNVIDKKQRGKRALELLELTGVSKHKDKLPSMLSGGEQQRAAIARALANDPPIIVADEPTGNLDSMTTLDILYLFDRLAKQGKTVIVVTHEETHNEYERIIKLLDGKIIEDTHTTELVS